MMQPVYIRSTCTISPQDTFDTGFIPETLISTDNNKLFVHEPNYRNYINPVAIRRMSRLLKAGISAGMQSLKDAQVEKPDGIITGTGRGSMTDTEIFTKDIIKYKEEALNPTYFIQSTYNSINGWLALQTKCRGYNQTYVHRSTALALALLDAQMLLNETDEHKTYLVGCFDELTTEYFHIKNKIHYWKKEPINSLELYKHNDTAGTIAGEGTSFFTVTNDSSNAESCLLSTKAIQSTSAEEVKSRVEEMLSAHNISWPDIDVMVCGMNGDVNRDGIYSEVINARTDNCTISNFKHLCGEFDAAVGFGLWLANKMIATQQIPESVIHKKGTSNSIKYVLLVNQYILNGISIMLLKQP